MKKTLTCFYFFLRIIRSVVLFSAFFWSTISSITCQDIFFWEGISLDVLDVETDFNGNRIVIGYGYPPHDLDPGPGTYEMDTNGDDAFYLASYKRTGLLNFVIPFYNPEIDRATTIHDVAVDGLNNIYVIGTFRGSLDLDPSSAMFWVEAASEEEETSFLASYDSDGKFRYGVRVPEFSFNRYGDFWGSENQILEADISGNVCVMLDGGENEALDINPKQGELIIDVPVVASYNLEGDLRYVIPVPGIYAETIIDVSPNGSLAIAGVLDTDWDFDPTDDEAVLSGFPIGGYFLATYNQDGNLKIAHKIEGGLMRTMFLEWDNKDNLYLAGTIFDETDFDPGSEKGYADNKFPEEFGLQDIFIARYLNNGSIDHVTVIGDLSPDFQSDESIAGIRTTPAGDIYLVAQMDAGYVDVDPGPDSVLVGTGESVFFERQTFIAGYDTTGNLIYYQRLNFQDYEFFPVAMERNCPTLVIAERANSGDFPDYTSDVGGDSISFVIPEWAPFVMSLPVASSALDLPGTCNPLVSTTEPIEQISVNIFPNPASSNITIDLQKDMGEVRIELFDVLGRLKSSGVYDGLNSVIEFSLASLPPNLYWFRITRVAELTQGVFPIIVHP